MMMFMLVVRIYLHQALVASDGEVEEDAAEDEMMTMMMMAEVEMEDRHHNHQMKARQPPKLQAIRPRGRGCMQQIRKLLSAD